MNSWHLKHTKQQSVWGSTCSGLTSAEELSRAPPPAWPIAPRFSCSRPWDPEFTKVEAKEGSLASTTRLLTRLREPEGPPVPSDPSVNSKWDTASLMLRVGSGSREMGGISNTSSPRLGVWNVCCMWRKTRNNGSVRNDLKHTCKHQHSEDVLVRCTAMLFGSTHLRGQKGVARSADGQIAVAALWKLKQTVSIQLSNVQLRHFHQPNRTFPVKHYSTLGYLVFLRVATICLSVQKLWINTLSAAIRQVRVKIQIHYEAIYSKHAITHAVCFVEKGNFLISYPFGSTIPTLAEAASG